MPAIREPGSLSGGTSASRSTPLLNGALDAHVGRAPAVAASHCASLSQTSGNIPEVAGSARWGLAVTTLGLGRINSRMGLAYSTTMSGMHKQFRTHAMTIAVLLTTLAAFATAQ